MYRSRAQWSLTASQSHTSEGSLLPWTNTKRSRSGFPQRDHMDIRQRHREWRGFVQVVVMSALYGVQGQPGSPKSPTPPSCQPSVWSRGSAAPRRSCLSIRYMAVSTTSHQVALSFSSCSLLDKQLLFTMAFAPHTMSATPTPQAGHRWDLNI